MVSTQDFESCIPSSNLGGSTMSHSSVWQSARLISVRPWVQAPMGQYMLEYARVAQWIRRPTSNRKNGGSIPSVGFFYVNVAEWLSRLPAKQVSYGCAGSNPVVDENIIF